MDRRSKLLDLVQSRFEGSQAKFAAAIKRSPSQVNQWITGHRALGDAGARTIEVALKLPLGYFDSARELRVESPASPAYREEERKRPLPPAIQEVVDIMLSLCEAQRGEVLGYARRVAETAFVSRKGNAA